MGDEQKEYSINHRAEKEAIGCKPPAAGMEEDIWEPLRKHG